ncbi:hypothetical protein WMF11_36165 [Sorangium sp. So ce295]|uniref:hypothetical protein n=1 Tax=Sorangium sp. So ce295 TaxID=3133295 RepID=UPI003F6290C5
MRTRSLVTAFLACVALANASCAMDASDGDEWDSTEETGDATLASTVSGWTGWSSGSCGIGGCTPIVSPTCANGSFASRWESNSSRSQFRIFCTPGPSSTTNHVWTNDCPSGKVATGVQCVTTSAGGFCSTATLRCSTPGGEWGTGSQSQNPTTIGTNRYQCPDTDVTGYGYVDRINYTGGVCGTLWGPLDFP